VVVGWRDLEFAKSLRSKWIFVETTKNGAGQIHQRTTRAIAATFMSDRLRLITSFLFLLNADVRLVETKMLGWSTISSRHPTAWLCSDAPELGLVTIWPPGDAPFKEASPKGEVIALAIFSALVYGCLPQARSLSWIRRPTWQR
jgi:hypothetical protein